MAPLATPLLLAALIGSALVSGAHNHLHRRQTQSSSSSVAIPYAYGNGTDHRKAAGTHHVTHLHTKTVKVEEIAIVYVNAEGQLETTTSTVTTMAPAQSAYQASSGGAAAAAPVIHAVDNDVCPGPTTVYVTQPAAPVTNTVTVTVTVTPGVTVAQSSSSSSSSAVPPTSAPSSSAVAIAQAVDKNAVGGFGGSGAPQYSAPAESSTTAPAAVATTAATTAAAYNPPVAQTSSAAGYSSSPASSVCKRSASGKKGCMTNPGQESLCAVLNDNGAGCTWHGNWNPNGQAVSGMEFVPQLHSVDGQWMQWWQESSLVASADYIMNVNEPMQPGQAAVSGLVSQATVEAEFSAFKLANKNNAQILSPSLIGNSDGVSWLAGFDSSMYDIVNAHYYEDCTTITTSKNLDVYLGQINGVTSKPIWVTEVGCHPGASQDQIIAFMNAASASLESNSQVHRYAWFMTMQSSGADGYLINGNGLSAYGSAFVAAGCN